MSLVATGTLVLCLILKPNIDNQQPTNEETKQNIQKVLGTVKEVFKKKVVRDSKDLRVALHDDKDMLVVETLDGEAEITIGADACKRVVEKTEYDEVKKKALKKEENSLSEVKTQTSEEKKENPSEKKQTDVEKKELLKLLE